MVVFIKQKHVLLKYSLKISLPSPHNTKRNYKPIIVNIPMLVIKIIPIYLLSVFCFLLFC